MAFEKVCKRDSDLRLKVCVVEERDSTVITLWRRCL